MANAVVEIIMIGFDCSVKKRIESIKIIAETKVRCNEKLPKETAVNKPETKQVNEAAIGESGKTRKYKFF